MLCEEENHISFSFGKLLLNFTIGRSCIMAHVYISSVFMCKVQPWPHLSSYPIFCCLIVRFRSPLTDMSLVSRCYWSIFSCWLVSCPFHHCPSPHLWHPATKFAICTSLLISSSAEVLNVSFNGSQRESQSQHFTQTISTITLKPPVCTYLHPILSLPNEAILWCYWNEGE